MMEKIIIAGAGGQGIMLLGRVMAEAAMREDKFVTWLPAYGAEVRGGTAYCMVVIADREISSPSIDKADTLMIMNEPSLARFLPCLRNKGLLIANTSLIDKEIDDKKFHILKYPFTDIAIQLGNIRVANMVALGCYIAKSKIVATKTVLKVMEDFAPKNKKELIRVNQQALFAGSKLIRGQ
jgi:2-oxoglutarate ferredoxin oxidoreductase subunit gamma